MSLHEEIENVYFDWMYSIVTDKDYVKNKKLSYRKLLSTLHTREFYFILPMDENRALDGIDLRNRFAYECSKFEKNDIMECLNGPCSVLEMMVALAVRMEDEIMGFGSQWFWLMIFNMGLNDMLDGAFDRKKVEHAINILLDREYQKDGTGGLFIVKHHAEDLRNIEIWYQMQWYLGEINIGMR